MTFTSQLISELNKEIIKLPDGFYDTFKYTTTGRNYTHPITLSILSKILSQMKNVQYVAIDFRLKEGDAKFRPDLVALSKLEPFQPVLFIDYESPNSSDMRIPTKNIDAYIAWSKIFQQQIPYIIITTLPDKKPNSWELRYTSEGYPNAAFTRKKKDIFMNPFQFWYSEYKKSLKSKNLNDIFFINIDGKIAKQISLL